MSVHLLSGDKWGFAEGVEESLVGFGVLDCAEVVLGTGANEPFGPGGGGGNAYLILGRKEKEAGEGVRVPSPLRGEGNTNNTLSTGSASSA